MTDKLKNLFQIEGKVVVITGAAGLLGIRHAEAIATFGGTPILLDLSLGKVQLYADELNKRFNVNAIGMSVDITDERQIKDSVHEIISRYGKIDGLVNNAANNPKIEQEGDKNFLRLENFPLEIWNMDIAVGLTGAFLCSKHYGSKIAENPEGGSIINISSDLGLIAPDQRLYYKRELSEAQQSVKPVTYSIVKTGIIGLTRYLSSYWAEKNVRCNAICPGGVENGQSKSFLKEVSSRIPMNRLAEVDEYQGTLVWMLSDASSYLNGAIIPVDGGRTAW
jgi:NAD(P)-dependent dehydrogenase (short-subunit alcohol dehydrogenase family)